MNVPHLSLELDSSKILDCFDRPGLDGIVEILPSLTFAERVIWALSGVKKASSFDLEVDGLRISPNTVEQALMEAGLVYRPADKIHPENVVAQYGWNPSPLAHKDQPYRNRDLLLAQWFDYPVCCVEGYRDYYDTLYDETLLNFPFRDIRDARQLDDYAFPGGVRNLERFREVVDYFASTKKHGYPKPIGSLVEPLRVGLGRIYSDSSFNLILHFCYPAGNIECPDFRKKGVDMYSVLASGVSVEYASLVAQRSVFMDRNNICF